MENKFNIQMSEIESRSIKGLFIKKTIHGLISGRTVDLNHLYIEKLTIINNCKLVVLMK